MLQPPRTLLLPSLHLHGRRETVSTWQLWSWIAALSIGGPILTAMYRKVRARSVAMESAVSLVGALLLVLFGAFSRRTCSDNGDIWQHSYGSISTHAALKGGTTIAVSLVPCPLIAWQ